MIYIFSAPAGTRDRVCRSIPIGTISPRHDDPVGAVVISLQGKVGMHSQVTESWRATKGLCQVAIGRIRTRLALL